MSHVREGELHAYLDGALDRLGADRAAEVREHLSRCDDCRSRLEEERGLRAAADQLLDLGGPGPIEMPPFEEIRRRAAAGPAQAGAEGPQALEPQTPAVSGPVADLEAGADDEPVGGGVVRDDAHQARRTLGRAQRWAWAASLVLALGTGWMLRGSGLEMASRPSLQAPDAAVFGPASADAPAAAEAEPRAVEDAESSVGRLQVQQAAPAEAEAELEAEAFAEEDLLRRVEGAAQTVDPVRAASTTTPAAGERQQLALQSRAMRVDSFAVLLDANAPAVALPRTLTEVAAQPAAAPAEVPAEVPAAGALADAAAVVVGDAVDPALRLAPGLDVIAVSSGRHGCRGAPAVPRRATPSSSASWACPGAGQLLALDPDATPLDALAEGSDGCAGRMRRRTRGQARERRLATRHVSWRRARARLGNRARPASRPWSDGTRS